MSIPIPHVPLSPPRQRKTKQQMIVHANAPQPDREHEPEPDPELAPAPAPQVERPYLLKKLQHGLGTRVLGDTLDWDGEFSAIPSGARTPPPLGCPRPISSHPGENSEFYFIVLIALAHYNLDASMLSLDNVYKGLKGDLETYYFLWVAVRKVLAEAPNVKLDYLFQILRRACWKKDNGADYLL